MTEAPRHRHFGELGLDSCWYLAALARGSHRPTHYHSRDELGEGSFFPLSQGIYDEIVDSMTLRPKAAGQFRLADDRFTNSLDRGRTEGLDKEVALYSFRIASVVAIHPTSASACMRAAIPVE